jgi:hypothetical protein
MSTAPAHSLNELLKKLTRGLSYQSESDYPVKPFFAEGKRRKSLKAADLPTKKRPVKEVDVDSFFGNYMNEQGWWGEEERKTAERYTALVAALKENLSDIKVFKAGEVEIDAYVVGRTPQGDFAGVTTKVVET